MARNRPLVEGNGILPWLPEVAGLPEEPSRRGAGRLDGISAFRLDRAAALLIPVADCLDTAVDGETQWGALNCSFPGFSKEAS
jgi:hypothetical protein